VNEAAVVVRPGSEGWRAPGWIIGGAVCAAALAQVVFMLGIGRSAEVPWVIWPAMTALPTAWVFIALASGLDALEPIIAVMQLVGIAIAFAWALVRPGGSPVPAVARGKESGAVVASGWRPVA
jgi:hypothetical protein